MTGDTECMVCGAPLRNCSVCSHPECRQLADEHERLHLNKVAGLRDMQRELFRRRLEFAKEGSCGPNT